MASVMRSSKKGLVMLAIAIEVIIGIFLVNELVYFFFDINLVEYVKKLVKKTCKVR